MSFPATGTYTITLKASNDNSESTASEDLSVKLIDAEYKGTVSTVGAKDKVNAEALKYSSLNLSTEYKLGFNKYYNKFAEKFTLPEKAEAQVNGFKFNIDAYGSGYLMSQKDYPVSIKIVGDKDGMPDETKEFGKLSTTELALFGSAAVSNAVLNVTLTTPVEVEGTFHVVFDIDQSLENDLLNYLSFGSFYHASDNASFSAYVKNGAVEGISEGWNKVYSITKDDADKKLGWNVGVNMTLKPYATTGATTVAKTNVAVTAQDGNIFISGITEATEVAIYNILGAKLYQATATGDVTVNASAFAGSICIVKVGGQSFKLLVK